MTRYTNPMDPDTPILIRDRKTDEIRENPGFRLELQDALDLAYTNLSRESTGIENLTDELLAQIGARPLRAYPTLLGLAQAFGGQSYQAAAWGGLAGRYEAAVMGSEAWSQGEATPSATSRDLRYLQLAGDTPADDHTALFTLVAQLPDSFRGWKEAAIKFRHQINSVSGHNNGDEVRSRLRVNPTFPGATTLTKDRVVTLGAGAYSESAWETTIVSRNELGDGWRAGDLVLLDVGFVLDASVNPVSVQYRWADLELNWE